jgi:hypothetical protein
MATIQEGSGNIPQQAFVRWNDPQGNLLAAVNRDGTIMCQGLVETPVNQQEQGGGGVAPFFIGGIQDHALGMCAYTGTGTSYAENAIAFARFTIPVAIKSSGISGYITDGANSGSVGKFVIYDITGTELLAECVFPVDTSKIGAFYETWTNGPVTLQAGGYILAWSACQETIPGTAKLESLAQNNFTTMSNLGELPSFGTSNQVMLGAPTYLFPPTLGTLTANNHMTLMPLVYLAA